MRKRITNDDILIELLNRNKFEDDELGCILNIHPGSIRSMISVLRKRGVFLVDECFISSKTRRVRKRYFITQNETTYYQWVVKNYLCKKGGPQLR